MIEPNLLDPGEETVWSGRPNASWYAFGIATTASPFLWFVLLYFVLVLFGFFFKSAPAQSGASLVPSAIIVAVAVALCFAAVALLLWFRASQTRYLLTNRRLVIDIAGPISRRISVPLEHVRFTELRSRPIGPGDLIFIERTRRTFRGWRPVSDGFIAIPDSAKVEKLVREAINQTFSSHTRGPWQ